MLWIYAASVPNGLQADLERFMDRRKPGTDARSRACKDLAGFLSDHHLQHIYSRFLSPRPVIDTGLPAGDNHPVWRATADLLRTTDTANITVAPARISATITEHIREYATVVSNLWEGAIFDNLLGYVLLLLLRLRLAPRRKQQHKDRVQAAAQRKKDDAERKRGKKVMSRGRWNREKLKFCNELADVRETPATPARMQARLSTRPSTTYKPTSPRLSTRPSLIPSSNSPSSPAGDLLR
ncbi:hypothetical protein BGZ72_008123, partial [Mortierella alpina]